MNESLSRRVLSLYADVDADVAAAGPVCIASGKCCRFKEYGHTLFLSGMEAEVLLVGAPSFRGPISADFCPYQRENLCTARESRPLGCRIYFCDPNYQDKSRELTELYLGKLKKLADEENSAWRYAPLHQFLQEHLEEQSA